MIGGVVRVTTASNRGRSSALTMAPGVEAEVVGHPAQVPRRPSEVAGTRWM